MNHSTTAPKPARRQFGIFFFGLLFALGFGAGGWFAGIRPLLHASMDYMTMRNWVAVPAQVGEAALKRSNGSEGGTTYRATVRYTYRYADREYTGTRVGVMDGGSDNIGDWQAEWHHRLDAARAGGRSIEAWANPASPEQSVLDRDLRAGKVAFHLVFATLFPLAALLGGYLALNGLRIQPTPTNAAAIEGGPSGAAILWGIAMAVLLVSGLPVYLVFSQYSGPNLGWLVLLFPAVALLLFYMGWRMHAAHKRVGMVRLRLADLQPRVGGVMRGLIEFDQPPGDAHYRLRLQCDRNDSKSDSNSNNSFWESESSFPAVGNRIPFQFHIPPDQPHSEEEGRITYSWKLWLQSDSMDVAEDFSIWIYPRDASKEVTPLPVEPEKEDASLHVVPIPPEIATLEKGLTQLRVHYGAGRHRSMAVALLISGLGFTAVGLALGLLSSFPLAFALLPLLIGIVSLYFGVRLWRSGFELRIANGELFAERSNLFGTTRAHCFVKEIVSIYPALTYSSGQGMRDYSARRGRTVL